MRNYGMLLGVVGWIHNPSASISRWERETGDSPDAVGQLVGLLHTVSNNRVLDYNPWGGPLASICSLWHLSTIVACTHMDMETCAHTRMHKHEHTETCTHTSTHMGVWTHLHASTHTCAQISYFSSNSVTGHQDLGPGEGSISKHHVCGFKTTSDTTVWL